MADYFFINSSTAEVIALTPVRKVGSGSGSNRLECRDGRGFPDFLLASTLAGSIAPSQNIQEGIVLSKLRRPKSSLPIIGGHLTTLLAPTAVSTFGALPQKGRSLRGERRVASHRSLARPFKAGIRSPESSATRSDAMKPRKPVFQSSLRDGMLLSCWRPGLERPG